MSRIAWLVCACGLAFATAPAFADERKPDPKPADTKADKKTDSVEKILDALAQECVLEKGTNLNEVPLFELLQVLTAKHGVTFVINEETFKAIGSPNIRESKPTAIATALGNVTLRQFLAGVLEGLGAAYLVKNGVIEIATVQYVAKVTKSGTSQDEDSRPRLSEPLVSAIVKEKPLNEVVAKIAEQYDLTVVVAPQAADAKAGFVTARLLNVPADKAIELLALQCDLRVVRRGAAYFLTSREHANELFGEKLDKERQQIEVQKLREAPAVPPGLILPPGLGQPAPAPQPKPPEKAP